MKNYVPTCASTKQFSPQYNRQMSSPISLFAFLNGISLQNVKTGRFLHSNSDVMTSVPPSTGVPKLALRAIHEKKEHLNDSLQ